MAANKSPKAAASRNRENNPISKCCATNRNAETKTKMSQTITKIKIGFLKIFPSCNSNE